MIKLPFIGSYLAFFVNPISYFEKVFRQQGNVAVIDFGLLGKTFFLFDPDDIEMFFSLGKRLHRKRFNQLFGNGLFTLETGSQAVGQRNVLKKCFTTPLLEHMIAIIEKRSQQLFLTCLSHPQGVCLPEVIKPFVKKLQLALVIGETSEIEEKIFLEHLEVILFYLNREFSSFIKVPDHWPTPTNCKFQKSLRVLKALIEHKVASCLTDKTLTQAWGILPALVSIMSVENEEPLSKSIVCNEILSLLIAGTETSSAIVTWMLHLLACSPHVQQTLKKEIQTLSCSKEIQLHSLLELPFSRSIVQETLRLYPPAWAIIRNLSSPLKTKTHEIPAKSTVWAVSYITHRHPDFWENPEEFSPHRFEMNKQQARAKFAFFPFGGGGHRCIAERFVMTQAQVIAITVGRYYELTAVTPEKLMPKAGIALVPRKAPVVICKKCNENTCDTD